MKPETGSEGKGRPCPPASGEQSCRVGPKRGVLARGGKLDGGEGRRGAVELPGRKKTALLPCKSECVGDRVLV